MSTPLTVKAEVLTAPVGSVLQTGETASAAVAAQAAAMIQARYVIALRNPRDLDTVRERLMKECKRPGFARVARYKKPIGQGIVGPSIRFAEAAIRCMGNVVVETVTLFDDREKRIIQVNVTDLEANVPYTSSVTIDKTVERRKTQDGDEVLGQRKNSQGITVFIVAATEDQLLNKQNALISKAIRTNGLRLVPGDIVEECMWQVVETQGTADAKDPDGAKLQIFDAFGNLGVTVAQLKKYLGHDGATLNPKELADLRALYSAIKDGETTWKDVVAVKEPDKEKKTMGDILGDKKKKAGTASAAGGNLGGPLEQSSASAQSTIPPAAVPAEPAVLIYTMEQREAFIHAIENHILNAKISEKAFRVELADAFIETDQEYSITEQPTAVLAEVAGWCASKGAPAGGVK